MTRIAIICVVVAAVLASPVAVATADDSAQASIEITVTTPHDDEPISAFAEGQPLDVEIRYSDLGPGDHEIEILEDDVVFDDELAVVTVSGSSGTERVTISGETTTETLAESPEPLQKVFVKVGRLESDNHVLYKTNQTVYLRDVPSSAEADEEARVTFYGWSDADVVPVTLMEDDPPLARGVGEDEQIRHREVPVTDNYYEGTFTFTPSDYVTDDEEADRTLELHARGGSAVIYETALSIGYIKNISVERPVSTMTASSTTDVVTTSDADERTVSPTTQSSTGQGTQAMTATEDVEQGGSERTEDTEQADSERTEAAEEGAAAETDSPVDSDGDGVRDSDDYAPNDPAVQVKADLESDRLLPEGTPAIAGVLAVVGVLFLSARWLP